MLAQLISSPNATALKTAKKINHADANPWPESYRLLMNARPKRNAALSHAAAESNSNNPFSLSVSIWLWTNAAAPGARWDHW